MVFQIECSDEKGAHVELRSDRTIRLFGVGEHIEVDKRNGAVVISERQTDILKALIIAEHELLKVRV